jgi:hypothetical protein
VAEITGLSYHAPLSFLKKIILDFHNVNQKESAVVIIGVTVSSVPFTCAHSGLVAYLLGPPRSSLSGCCGRLVLQHVHSVMSLNGCATLGMIFNFLNLCPHLSNQGENRVTVRIK